MRFASLRALARFLYTQNPFYVISACLVLYGLQVGLASHDRLATPGATAAGIAGFTLLIGLTTYFVVRLGRVWDDARSLFLILILLFLALSVSFDELCSTKPKLGAAFLAGGWTFCFLVLECLTRSIGLRVHAAFRVPLYTILAVLFAAPVVASPNWEGWLSSMSVSWRVLLFGILAGAATLTLIPAAIAGRRLVAGNGSPWPWPLMPWSLFAVMIVGIGLRTYSLTLSFIPLRALQSPFTGLALVPLAFASAWIVFEIGRSAGSRRTQRWSLLLAALAPLLVFAQGYDKEFVLELTRTVANPHWLAMLGLVGFALCAWLRGERWSELLLCAALLVLGSIPTDRFAMPELRSISVWPMGLVAVLQGWRGIQSGSSIRMVFGWTCFAATVSGGWQESLSPAAVRLVSVHLVMAGGLLIGWLMPADGFARWVRKASFGGLALASMRATALSFGDEVDTLWIAGYLLCVLLVFALHRRLLREAWFVAASVVPLLAFSQVAWRTTFAELRQLNGNQLILPLELGLVCFLAAAAITFSKTARGRQLWERVWHWWRTRWSA